MPKYSVIVPVYNRPDEVGELLESLSGQSCRDFEVVIVEDGSSIPCHTVCQRYSDRLDLRYFTKPNGGPGPARNYGAERATGEYLIILDSDVIVPKDYFANIEASLDVEPCDAFGGPDRAHKDFTDVQKAINYSMTSFLTTGGIRGGKKKLDKFYPRSFNLGIRRDVFTALRGFSDMRFGEDIDLSIRIYRGHYRCRLIPEAWVWHKRRSTFRQFFKQVFNSGMARINLYKKYPDTLKAVHLLPSVFTLGLASLIIMLLAGVAFILCGIMPSGRYLTLVPLLLVGLFALMIGVSATTSGKSLKVGALSVWAAIVQLTGYGSGFIYAWWNMALKRGTQSAFGKTFYD